MKNFTSQPPDGVQLVGELQHLLNDASESKACQKSGFQSKCRGMKFSAGAVASGYPAAGFAGAGR